MATPSPSQPLRPSTTTATATALTLSVIGDSDDPLIVAGELRDAIGDGRAEQRCEEIALRAELVAGPSTGSVSIEVVTERHDVVAQVQGESSVLDRTVHASCEVPT